jgi:hypothetical protein
VFSRKTIIGCILVAALIVPTAAMAAGGGSCSACDQYTESVPAASGQKKANKKPKVVKPSVPTQTALRSVPKAHRKTLKRFVTDERYGASIGRIPEATVNTPSASVGRSLGYAITNPGSGSTGRLGALLAIIVLTTIAVGVNAIRKQRT